MLHNKSDVRRGRFVLPAVADPACGHEQGRTIAGVAGSAAERADNGSHVLPAVPAVCGVAVLLRDRVHQRGVGAGLPQHGGDEPGVLDRAVQRDRLAGGMQLQRGRVPQTKTNPLTGH
jgi:hypothetical protein